MADHSDTPHDDPPMAPWRERLRLIIFEADTPSGKFFDVALLVLILMSVVVVMLESVEEYRLRYGTALLTAEWCFTVLFTVEYILRLMTVRRPMAYAKSFYGIVDLLSFAPTYLQLFIPGQSRYLLIIRILRLLRLFRIFKMMRYVGGANVILAALRTSRPKIIVFFFGVITLTIVMGTLMYIIEGSYNEGFSSIPQAAYWAIVTITTVGYGDVSPITPVGKALASLGMLMGYAVIAVPTGIFSIEIQRFLRREQAENESTHACPSCGSQGHASDAKFCRLCGDRMRDS